MTVAHIAFAGSFIIAGAVFAYGLNKQDFRKDPVERFLGGLMFIGLAFAVFFCLTGEKDIANYGALFAAVGFCIRSFCEYAVREHQNDMAFDRALAERSMKYVAPQTSIDVVV